MCMGGCGGRSATGAKPKPMSYAPKKIGGSRRSGSSAGSGTYGTPKVRLSFRSRGK